MGVNFEGNGRKRKEAKWSERKRKETKGSERKREETKGSEIKRKGREAPGSVYFSVNHKLRKIPTLKGLYFQDENLDAKIVGVIIESKAIWSLFTVGGSIGKGWILRFHYIWHSLHPTNFVCKLGFLEPPFPLLPIANNKLALCRYYKKSYVISPY